MKEITINLTDKEYRKLKLARKLYFKGVESWKDFILYKCSKGISEYKDL